MYSINVKNGMELQQFDNYTLYEMYTDNASKYYMCLPSSNQEDYQMVIDFPEEYYSSLLESEKIDEISHICDVLYKSNYNAIYVLPNITTYYLAEAKSENDNHAYQNLLKELHKYTKATYEAISNNEGVRINQVICIISQTDDDKKLMNWLELEMPNCFTSLDYSTLLDKDLPTTDSGWTTLGGPSEGVGNEHTNNKPKVRLLVPNKHGYLNVTFGLVITILSLIVSFGLATWLIK